MDNVEPIHMPYKLLKEMTGDFSDEKILGRGTFGVVYKGEDKDGQEIAVKLLHSVQGVDDIEFLRGCKNLAKVNHQNIVQLVGFCNETEEVPAEHNGIQVSAIKMHRALCFQYMENGSLQKHLSDESQGFGWHERYKIIKGVCEGLKYLHMRPDRPIYHLDLKPDNILLDENMVPKIDFGISTLLGEDSVRVEGACGYTPPEYIKHQVISKEFDIFSLGVIILKIMTGNMGYSIIDDMEPAEVLEHVYDKWWERLQAVPVYTSLEAHCQQVKRCVQIAVKCLEEERRRRPRIEEIILGLNETETNLAVQGSIHKGEDESYKGRRDNMVDNTEPLHMPYELMKSITDNFSDKRILGKGTFGVVYKGKDQDGNEIAVKLLNSMQGVDDKEFRREFNNLVKLEHQNIVKLVGFCNDEEEVPIVHNGNPVIALKMHRALCFEYMHNGSLHKHLTDERIGFGWQKRYKIIKGICQGLKYLHTELESPVYHLDLKPDNILLDENMVPKIADFGLSRLVGEENTKRTISPTGTLGYLPPEFIRYQIISREFDIFSLGVIIIKIMIGPRGYSLVCDMTPAEFADHVHNKWRERLQATRGYRSLEIDCQQVKKCIDIALKCIEEEKRNRPNICYIVNKLSETEKYKNDRASLVEEIGSLQFSSPETPADSSGGRSPKRKMNPPSELPMELPATFLKEITDNFSPERQLGQFVDGTVYKGVMPDGVEIAVKYLSESGLVIRGKNFHNEIQNLMGIQHENIVKLVAFCQEEEKRVVLHKGRYVIVDIVESLLCYEYPSKGSLDMYICDKTNITDWETRFKVIKGICQGLHFLHQELDGPLIHMNLLPSTVWLDDNFVAKITDFGLSRLFEKEKTRSITRNVWGQTGYMAPEYLYRGEVSPMSDIYSLGMLILEVTTAERNCTTDDDKVAREFVEKVQQNWKKDDHIQSMYPFLGAVSLRQVKTCIEIGLNCVEVERKKRPSIVEIVQKMNELREVCFVSRPISSELLEVYPTKLRFPFKPNKLMSCSLQLTNMTDDSVAVRLRAKSSKRYFAKMPLCGIVPPLSTYTLIVTMREQKKHLSSNDNEFLTLENSSVGDGDFILKNADLESAAIEYGNFFKKAKEEATNKVDEVMLTVFCDPSEETDDNLFVQSEVEILSMKNFPQVLSVDLHPTEPWIMTSHHGGQIFIWDYQTQAPVNSFDFTAEPVFSTKFIDREKWIVAGDGDGTIYVVSYDTQQEVTSFEAHDSRITSLAVHPTDPLVLSSSDDHLITLWDWNKGWECTRTFEGHSDTVMQVNFNLMNTNSFASASLDHTIRIWSLSSDASQITLSDHPDGLLCVHSYTSYIRQYLITGSSDGTAQIWDLETKKCVKKLEGHASRISSVYHHPELPVVITGSHDGTVRIWNSATYRLENIIGVNLGAVSAVVHINGSRRMVIGCHQGIAIMEINLP